MFPIGEGDNDAGGKTEHSMTFLLWLRMLIPSGKVVLHALHDIIDPFRLSVKTRNVRRRHVAHLAHIYSGHHTCAGTLHSCQSWTMSPTTPNRNTTAYEGWMSRETVIGSKKMHECW